MNPIWALPALLLATVAQTALALEGERRLVVVELFTSQGCSSCPPADALLVSLAQDRPDILPLAFHITYWDRLGWRDPFSLEAATERQRRYSKTLRSSSVYTPEVVVDGHHEAVGSNRTAVFAAIQAAKLVPQSASLRVSLGSEGIRIDVDEGKEAGTVLLIGYDAQHRTDVRRGENHGRSLIEANIVRSIQPIGRWQGPAFQIVAQRPSGEHAAVLVQANNGRILGAARAY